MMLFKKIFNMKNFLRISRAKLLYIQGRIVAINKVYTEKSVTVEMNDNLFD